LRTYKWTNGVVRGNTGEKSIVVGVKKKERKEEEGRQKISRKKR